MEFSNFTFILTTDCNFRCSHCYQKNTGLYLDVNVGKQAVDFIFPHLAEEAYFNFFGGEPFLAYDLMKDLTAHIEHRNAGGEKSIFFSVTTNGSLLQENILQFLDTWKFSVLLSFDGAAQESSGHPGCFHSLMSTVAGLRQCQGIDLATNIVFTPESIGNLSESVGRLLEKGVASINISYSSLSRWDHASLSRLESQLTSVRRMMFDIYQNTGNIPVSHFKMPAKTGGFFCSAGKDRLALSPEGLLWGCCFFYDFMRRQEKPKETSLYCFGSLGSFSQRAEELYHPGLRAYANLGTEYFFTKNTFCQSCDDAAECVVCPAEAAFSSHIVGMVPEDMCQLRRILREERRRFWAGIEDVHRQNPR